MTIVTRSRTVHSVAPTATYFYGLNEKNQTVAVTAADLRGAVSVTDFGADPAATDNTAEIAAAVASALASNSALEWAPGTYLTSGSITGLHDVQHVGIATIQRGSNLFQIRHNRSNGLTNTLYVDPLGSDTNDGLSATEPLATLQRAFDILEHWGSGGLAGAWEIQCAAGDVGPLVVTGINSDLPIEVIGVVAGHPNVPTTYVDGQSGGGRGIDIANGMYVRFTDILVKDYTTGTALVNTKSQVSGANFHVDNCLYGCSALHTALTSMLGGIWDGGSLGGDGYRTFYNATHNFTQVSADPATDALHIKNFGRGMLINEGGQGHLDDVNITDCTEAGINLKRGAGAVNTSGMVLKRNAIGVLVENNAWYNNNIAMGTGADANTVNVKTMGNSPELAYTTIDNQARNVLQVAVSGVSSHTGTTAKTLLWESEPIPAWVFSLQTGHTHTVRAFGTVAAPSAGTITIRVEFYNGTTSSLCGEVVLPVGTSVYDIECITAKAASTTWECFTRGFANGVTPIMEYRSFGASFVDVDGYARVYATLSDAADSVSRKVILNSTHAG